MQSRFVQWQMLLLVGLFLIGSCSCSQTVYLDGPLLNGVTSFTVTAETSTLTKATPCFVTPIPVSQCRRKRGIEERPKIIQGDHWQIQITPSAVIRVEPTNAPIHPRSRLFQADKIVSSFDDSYSSTLNIFRQLEARGRSNIITVGNCGMSRVNFSQFLSCLGMTVQETTTLTATFTETETLSSGYATMTVLGCTPAGFPYTYCPTDSTFVTDPIQSSTISYQPNPSFSAIEESFTCEWENKTLTCPDGQGIVIDFANYGRTTHPVCVMDPVRDAPNTCSTPSHTNFVATFCNGQSNCVVPATNSFFGDTCPNVFKYLQIKSHCETQLQQPSTTELFTIQSSTTDSTGTGSIATKDLTPAPFPPTTTTGVIETSSASPSIDEPIAP